MSLPTKQEILTNLAANTMDADFFKHLNEGDYSAHMAELTAKYSKLKIAYTTFCLLASDDLEIEIDSYIDEVESGRR